MDLSNFCQYDKKFAFKIIGSFIRNKRQSLHISETSLAECLNVEPQEVGKIESGIRYLKDIEFSKIITFLDLSQTELLEILYIIESKYLINMYRALDANFPK